MKPLYLTAHYDDMEVGAGGTASRFGGTSIVLYPKEGTHGKWTEANAAANILGVKVATQWQMGERESVEWLDARIRDHDTIISTSPYDSHPEHQKVASIARQVARRNNVNLWWMDHAIPGGMGNGPRPNMFVSFEGYAKYAALEKYEVMRSWRNTVEDRDVYYGIMNGDLYAEGFIVEHGIIGETK